jgi:hypothetical protein
MSPVHQYREKAAEAIELARHARQEGRESAHSGYVSERCFGAPMPMLSRGAPVRPARR